MSISTTSRKSGPYAGTGAPANYPFDFKVFQDTDLEVVAVTALGVESTLVLGVNYTAALNPDQDNAPGGQITTTLALGSSLVITSDLPFLQEVNVTNGGGFFPDVFNGVFDRLTIFAQQLMERTTRSIRFPITDDSNSYGDLPSAVQRMGRLLAFNTLTGAPEAGPSSADITSSVNAAAASASAAASAQSAAEAARDQTLTAFDQFDDRYLGAKGTAPALDNDGQPLVAGALYYNDGSVVPANSGMYVYTGSMWVAAYVSGAGFVAKSGDQMTGALDFANTVTLASAATVNIGAAASNCITISGTTGITSFGPAPDGAIRVLRFSGTALSISNGGSTIVLPNGLGIRTENGDVAVFRGEGGNLWRCVSYQRFSGAPLRQTAIVSQTAAGPVAGLLHREYQCNTSANAITINLPSSVITNDRVFVGRDGPNAVTIGRNGNTIVGDPSDLVLDVDNIGVWLEWDGSTWTTPIWTRFYLNV